MPVPIDRHDPAYFEPLAKLKRGSGMDLFLGVVHAADGVEGTVRRMRTASEVTPHFGIATECGISRARTPELVHAILEIHGQAAKAFPI